MKIMVRMLCFALFMAGAIWSNDSKASMHATQAEAYTACMAVAKVNYEARVGEPIGATAYRCVRMSPNANAYVGEIWLRNCVGCAYYWSHGYGVGEWPYASFDQHKNLGPGQCCTPKSVGTHTGNPINMATGNKYQRGEDFSFSALLSFARHYNSYGAYQQYGLGAGWTHSYSKRIEYSDTQYGGLVAKVHRPTGGYLTFLKQQDGSWVPDTDVFDALTTEKDISGVAIGWTFLNRRDQETETYDILGRLAYVSTQSGDTVAFEYNNGVIEGDADDLLLTKITDRAGRSIALSYDGAGKLTAIVDPAGNSYGYAYDGQGRLSSVTYPGAASVGYLYNEPSFTSGANLPLALTGIVDESGQRYATYKYDSVGRAISTEHAGAVDKFQIAYSENTQATVTESLGNPQYRNFGTYSGVKKLTYHLNQCATCPLSATTYSYDSLGHLDSEKDFLGYIADYDRDANDLETQLVEAKNTPKQRKTQTDWNSALRRPLERRAYDAANALVAKSTWTYNPRGQALTASQIDPVTAAVRTATTTYCEQADVTAGTCPLLGLVTATNGARTDVTDNITYTYYGSDDATCVSSPTTCPHRKGDLWKVADALGRITETLAYDGAGRVLSVKDANGVITDMEYHPRGWLTARKVRGANPAAETDDQITAIEYWPTGLVKKVTQPDGAFTAYTYDAAHRLTDIADNAGNTIHYTLDNAGNRTAEATKDSGNTLRRSLSRVYNQLGQLQTAKDAYNHATGFTYDANGNNQTVTDALSRVTDNDYDPLNRLARTLQDVGGIAAETKFEYDARDNLTKVTDPKGLDTTYQYNGLGDLTQLTSPDTGVTTYTYDSAGNRQTQTDARGIVSTYSYDALNRLTGIAYPTSSLNVGYVYDTVNASCVAGETFAIGRLTQMTDSSGDTQYCYDRFGNLTRKRQTTNGIIFTVRYAYTLAGQLQTVTYPDGAIVDYVRDGQGRTTEVGVTPAAGTRQVLLNQATYHPFGPIAGWTYGNGRTMSRTLNQNYQPVAIEDPNTGGLSLGYEFDAVGNLSKLYNADQSVTKAQYGYDALNRLADVKDGPTGAVIEHYGYDATGNRTSLINAGGTTNYTYPGTNHRLTQVGATARIYDNVGNITQIDGTAKEFVYNDANRMSQVKASGTATMNYQFNGRGEQVRKYLNANSTYTVYDEAGRWIGDYDASGNPIQQATWLGDLPVGLLASNQRKYLQPDHLGTPRAVIDQTVNIAVWRWDLEGEAFGNTAPNQDPDADSMAFVLNMRFPGQRYDSTSGFSYNYFRNFDSGTGRYAESDPLGLYGGISTYGFVSQQPMHYVDPLGLVHWSGKSVTVGAAAPIGGMISYYDLMSDCIKGRRAKVRVIGVGPSLGVEVRTRIRMPVAGGTGSNIDFNDQWDDLYPEFVFNGLYTTFGFGGALVVGGDCSVHAAGINLKAAPFGDGAQYGGCGPSIGMAGLGASVTMGTSTLLSVDYQKCDECKPE